MPIDEYKCPRCDHMTQRMRDITEEAPAMIECKNCSTRRRTAYAIKQIPTGIAVKITGGPTKGKLNK